MGPVKWVRKQTEIARDEATIFQHSLTVADIFRFARDDSFEGFSDGIYTEPDRKQYNATLQR